MLKPLWLLSLQTLASMGFSICESIIVPGSSADLEPKAGVGGDMDDGQTTKPLHVLMTAGFVRKVPESFGRVFIY